MGISASSIDLIVAVSGLKEVQGVIAAMRAADAAVAASRGAIGAADTVEPRRVIHPDPRYEPRPVIHPTPRYEPRPVVHPSARVAECRGPDRCDPPEVIVVEKAPAEQPLQPPWKTVPWENPPRTSPAVKIAPPHPDIRHKGMLLDFFI